MIFIYVPGYVQGAGPWLCDDDAMSTVWLEKEKRSIKREMGHKQNLFGILCLLRDSLCLNADLRKV